MSAAPAAQAPPAAANPGLTEPRWVRWTLIGVVVTFLAAFLLLPVAVVFHEALRQGLAVYWRALSDPVAVAAIELTLVAAGVSVAANTAFGIAAAWTVTRFRFPGKSLLLTLIDLPFAVSPVIAGLIFVLVFGAHGWAAGHPVAFLWPALWWGTVAAGAALLLGAAWGAWRGRRPGWAWWTASLAVAIAIVAENGPVLAWWDALHGLPARPWRSIAEWLAADNDLPVIFATPGIALATAFVTFPFVARELIPVMQSVGQEEEQAALSLGASGWTIFWRITLPNVKWGLLYGLILCNARAMGEFGAVSVVSGHIRGQTDTMPLHIEILFNEYQFAAAFAMASLLAALALVTLVAKTLIEQRLARRGDGA